MLTIVVGDEGFDEEKQEFVLTNSVELTLEHSLVSLSKWESKFEKPYLSAGEKTDEEAFAYIECMILTPNFPPGVSQRLSQQNVDAISSYVEAKQTATYFVDQKQNPKTSEEITAELIYYWMVAFEIPWEAQYWHLNRLFTLIRVCNVKNAKPKKRSPAEMMAERKRLNDQRRAQYKTTG